MSDVDIAELQDKLIQSEANAKASEMMLKQVCEERDKAAFDRDFYRKECEEYPLKYESIVNERLEFKDARDALYDLIHSEDGYIASQEALRDEIVKLRELLRDCPLLKFQSTQLEYSLKSEIAWAERAKEEVLKL